ncbi:MAG: hypothetical protein QOG06_2444 [Gaiellaceae bacterium]|jgi:hypothetical protein|nr:hypothetical protein [Gaiellaceae bacterium]MDX6507800.1 hypothetical protein [Gaiellaceae bacterium]
MDAEQIARNDAIFRDANERIEEAARRYDRTERVPFICECADPECRQLLVLSLEEYEGVRAESTHFIVLPGHEQSASEHVSLVEERPEYHIVEKIGEAADVAADLDARAT